MAILKQSTAYNRLFTLVTSAGVGVTGATVTVKICQGPGTFNNNAGGAGAIHELSLGWYYVALTSVDTNFPGELAFQITSTGGSGTSVPNNFVDQVQSQVFTDLTLNPAGNAVVSSNVKINQPLAFFPFVMTAVSSSAPQTGLVVSASRNFGSGWIPCTNTPTELGNGWYAISLTAADLNNAAVALRFTATGANDTPITIVTQP